MFNEEPRSQMVLRPPRLLSGDFPSNGTIAVIGAGGIGWWVCTLLAMQSWPIIHVFDSDLIESHNLERLPVAPDMLGVNKGVALDTYLAGISPQTTVRYYGNFEKGILEHPEHKGLLGIIECTDDPKVLGQLMEDIKGAESIPWVSTHFNGTAVSFKTRRVSNLVVPDAHRGYRDPAEVTVAVICAGYAVWMLLDRIKYNNIQGDHGKAGDLRDLNFIPIEKRGSQEARR